MMFPPWLGGGPRPFRGPHQPLSAVAAVPL